MHRKMCKACEEIKKQHKNNNIKLIIIGIVVFILLHGGFNILYDLTKLAIFKH